ncbi:NlpC/P60 family protein [Streptomyces sp. WAC 06738]|uniref:aggregation-promoting factor C-terminal-like domain-containing protein n=1 Tax=Streptomyces sp. WAC 06738 TaxID=2203210 RepID=UPI001F0BE9E8|nr:NlpC/P60 family protein [Streptomyces sp. WAC 06738]
MGTPPPPPGPPTPNPAGGRLFGANNLGQQLDALTRAFTNFTNRFASTAGLSTMGWHATNAGAGQRLGDQADRLQQQSYQAQGAHNAAYQRMQDEVQQQRIRWQQYQRTQNRIISDPRSTVAQEAEARQRLREGAQLYRIRTDAIDRDWDLRQNSFSSQMTRMNADMDRLRSQQTMQTTMNRIAMAGQVGGAIVGAARSYYSGGFEEMLGQFERRASLLRPDWGGSSGHRARVLGQEMKRYGTVMWGTSNEDVFAGASAILQQSPLDQYATNMRRASAAAYITPGLGIQGAAQMQNELGTGQAFYASQMFGLAPTRFAGGALNSPAAMALSLAQRVNNGGFGNLTGGQLAAQMAQGGSLSMSMANYARAAGLSGQTMEAMRNQTELLRDLMNPAKKGLRGLSSEEALKLIEDAGGRDSAGEKARARIQKYAPSVGDSYQDAQRYLQGLDREGHLPASASFLDAAKSSANTLADIHTLLQKALGPFADWFGGLTGAYKAGGPVGGTVSRVKDAGSGFMSGARSGWNSGPNVFFGDWGAGTDQSSWAKSAWHGLTSLFGGDSGTPESKQGGSKKTSDKNNDYPGAGVMKALAFANTQVGDKYVLGANGPDAWDCSSLVQHAYAAAGVKLPRTTYQQIHKGIEVPIDKVQPGDLVFYKDVSHVGIYAGGGKVIEAANPTRGVVEGPMYGKFKRARRILSGGVEATGTLDGDQSDPTKENGSTADKGGFTVAGPYGSVEEVDALAAALAGGAGTAQTGGSTPSATQNSEATSEDSGGGNAGKDAPHNVQANVKLGKKMAAKYGWTGTQWDDLYKLWLGESGWRHWAVNKDSGATGIPQSLPGSKMASEGSDWKTNPATQIAWGLKYIKGRYGNPGNAWAKWQARSPHWYKDGAWDVPGQAGEGLDAKLHGGEMVLERNTAHTVRQALLNQGLTPSPGQGSNSPAPTGSVNLHFGAGSVVVQMPTATAEGAKSAAQAFVSHIAADDRIKSMMGGW